MVFSACAMYGAAAFDATLEAIVPGDPSFATAPAVGAVAMALFLLLVGPRLPRWAMACFGPIGAAFIAFALATTPGAGDGAVLYVWPTLWMTFFFGRRGAIAIAAFIGVAHACTLLALPAASSYPGRWIDVMVTVSLVAAVTLLLVSRNNALLARLGEEARTDELTGLLNRRGFEERATLELARARREQQSLALAMFDLDHFKHINDEWGHEVGDRVLAHTASVLAKHSRDIDVTARYGGEEFLVLLPDTGGATAIAFTDRIREALAVSTPTGLPVVRLSAGVLAEVAPSDLPALIQRADSALYDAKRSGRDRTVIFRRESDGQPLMHHEGAATRRYRDHGVGHQPA
jgi:diguanylate cyclase (GGDEF)-like protein